MIYNDNYQDLSGGNVTYDVDGFGTFNKGYNAPISEALNLKRYNDSLGFNFGSAFDMAGDIGGLVLGGISTLDNLKTNKLKREGLNQNIKHSKMARQDRTNFLQGTKSAFA